MADVLAAIHGSGSEEESEIEWDEEAYECEHGHEYDAVTRDENLASIAAVEGELARHELRSVVATAAAARLQPSTQAVSAGNIAEKLRQPDSSSSKICGGAEVPSSSQISQGKRSRNAHDGPSGPRPAKRPNTAAGHAAINGRVSAQGRFFSLQAPQTGLLPTPVPASSTPVYSPPAVLTEASRGRPIAALVQAPTRTPSGLATTRTPPGVTIGPTAGTATPAAAASDAAATSVAVRSTKRGLLSARTQRLPPGVSGPPRAAVAGPMPFQSPTDLCTSSPAQVWGDAHAQFQFQALWPPDSVRGMPWGHQPPQQSVALPGVVPIAMVVDGSRRRLPGPTQMGLSTATPGRAAIAVRTGRGVSHVDSGNFSSRSGGAKALRERLKMRLSGEKKKRKEAAATRTTAVN